MLVNIPRLVSAYYTERPDPAVPEERVSFGTSGHRGSSFDRAFNECAHPRHHAGDLPVPARAGHRRPAVPRHRHARALRAGVSAARSKCSPPTSVDVHDRLANDGYTPTPARLARDPHLQPRPHQRARRRHRRHAVAQSARGRRLQVQPAARRARRTRRSPAGSRSAGQRHARRRPARREAHPATSRRCARRRRTATITSTPTSPICDAVLDLDVIRGAELRLGVDPLGGAGVHYWGDDRRALRHSTDRREHRRSIRPSASWTSTGTAASAWTARRRTRCAADRACKDRFDVAWACDTDHDRHGIVVAERRAACNPNHYLAVAIAVSLPNRPGWSPTAGGRARRWCQQQHDRPRGRRSRTAPLRSAGRLQVVRRRPARRLARLRRRGERGRDRSCAATARVWTTDKDGIIAALLAAEMTARTGRDPGELYAELTETLRRSRLRAHRRAGDAASRRRCSPGSSPDAIRAAELAGEPIRRVPDHGAGQRCADRRPEGRRRERLVRRPAVGHRRRLQDVRRELPRVRAPPADPGRGAPDRGESALRLTSA